MNWTNIFPWPLPAWYKLRVAYDKSKFNLIIDIHRLAQAYLSHMLQAKSERLQMLKSKFELPSFIFPRDKSGWGFGEVMFLKGSAYGEWLSWECPLPHNFEGGWIGLNAVAATLEMVLCFLRFFENPAKYYMSQLLLVEIGLRKSRANGISVYLSPQITEWVAKSTRTGRNYQPVLEAMKAAYDFMIGHDRETEFRAEIFDPRSIYLSVPGNACSLSSDFMQSEKWVEGVVLEPHNVDNALQLLALLAGVFALYLKANQGIQLLKYKAQIKEALNTGLDVHGYMDPSDLIFTTLKKRNTEVPFVGVDGELSLSEIEEIFMDR